MTVYALLIEYPYEGSILVGIFSSEEKAIEEWNKSPWKKSWYNYIIDKRKLDASVEIKFG